MAKVFEGEVTDILKGVFPYTQPLMILMLPATLMILSLWGGITVIYVSLICILIIFPVISYLSGLQRIKNLIPAFFFAVAIKVIYLLIKLIVSEGDIGSAVLSFGDAGGYAEVAFLDHLPLRFVSDPGYPLILQFMARQLFLQPDTAPLTFIIPSLFFGTLIAVFVCIAVKDVISPKYAGMIFWFVALDPMIALYSTTLLKDILVGAFVSVVFVVFIRFRNNIDYVLQISVLILAILMSVFLRVRSLGVVIICLLLRYYFSDRIPKLQKKLIAIPLILVIFSALLSMNIDVIAKLNKGKSISHVESTFSEAIIKKGAIDIRKTGRLNYILNSSDSWMVRVIGRSVLALLSPMPPISFYKFDWDVVIKEGKIFRDLGGIYWHFLFPFLLLGSYSFFKEKKYFPIVAFYLIIFLMGMTTVIDPRIRLIAVAPLYILSAKGISKYGLKNRFAYLYYLSVLFMVPVYEILM